ncbi:MAG: hypothetical protein KJP16_16115 [Gammaproteobacteria bacterium]|nr:hypothetical protein [Gammaproteobacteria bacterium]NNL52331.1 hypothetical protein [Woeseiaceae bacterium]
MKSNVSMAACAALALLACGTAGADFGVGLKAGTLGLGIEGRWSPIPWLDVRVGANNFEYDDNGSQAGITYDATFSLDTYYATGNFRFPLSPFRVTAGAFSNGNEFSMLSQDTAGLDFDIGGSPFNPADVGTLQSVTSFGGTAPYVGVGYDFEFLGKVGLNLDFGVLWQGDPSVTLEATGLADAPASVQSLLEPALETERLELEDEMSSFKAWPVVSLAFIYNF